MWSKVSILSLAVAVTASLSACKSDDQPDARIAQPNFPDAKVADAPLAMADARSIDAAGSSADAAATADAKVIDAAAGGADAASTPDATTVQADAKVIDNPATVILNEVAPGIGDNDLIELLVTKAGSTENIAVYQDYAAVGSSTPRLLAVLPATQVAVNDLVVIHMVPPDDLIDEVNSRAECVNAGCYAGAWDARGEAAASANIGYSYRTLVVKAANGDVLDAVPFMQHTDFMNKPVLFATDLPKIIAEGKWLTQCADPCAYTNLPNMYAASVNWSGAGNSATGNTTQRKAGGVREMKVSDWSATPIEQTLGAANTTN